MIYQKFQFYEAYSITLIIDEKISSYSIQTSSKLSSFRHLMNTNCSFQISLVLNDDSVLNADCNLVACY